MLFLNRDDIAKPIDLNGMMDLTNYLEKQRNLKEDST